MNAPPDGTLLLLAAERTIREAELVKDELKSHSEVQDVGIAELERQFAELAAEAEEELIAGEEMIMRDTERGGGEVQEQLAVKTELEIEIAEVRAENEKIEKQVDEPRDENEGRHLPASEKLDMLPPGSRPLAEPPITAYSEILEDEEDWEKLLQECGLWNNTKLRHLDNLKVECLQHLEYGVWGSDSATEAPKKEDLTRMMFCTGLMNALKIDGEAVLEGHDEYRKMVAVEQLWLRDLNKPGGEVAVTEEQNDEESGDADEVWYSASEEKSGLESGSERETS